LGDDSKPLAGLWYLPTIAAAGSSKMTGSHFLLVFFTWVRIGRLCLYFDSGWNVLFFLFFFSFLFLMHLYETPRVVKNWQVCTNIT
jgi:hypothetical protein